MAMSPKFRYRSARPAKADSVACYDEQQAPAKPASVL
jgi:hypothetical protein